MSKQCSHGEMTYRSGEKNGKPWAAYFCSQPKGAPDQCKPEWVRMNASNKFDAQLNTAAKQMDNSKKDELITRTAIAKSLIERGEKWGLEASQEAEQWLAWIQGKKPHTAAPAASDDDPFAGII